MPRKNTDKDKKEAQEDEMDGGGRTKYDKHRRRPTSINMLNLLEEIDPEGAAALKEQKKQEVAVRRQVRAQSQMDNKGQLPLLSRTATLSTKKKEREHERRRRNAAAALEEAAAASRRAAAMTNEKKVSGILVTGKETEISNSIQKIPRDNPYAIIEAYNAYITQYRAGLSYLDYLQASIENVLTEVGDAQTPEDRNEVFRTYIGALYDPNPENPGDDRPGRPDIFAKTNTSEAFKNFKYVYENTLQTILGLTRKENITPEEYSQATGVLIQRINNRIQELTNIKEGIGARITGFIQAPQSTFSIDDLVDGMKACALEPCSDDGAGPSDKMGEGGAKKKAPAEKKPKEKKEAEKKPKEKKEAAPSKKQNNKK